MRKFPIKSSYYLYEIIARFFDPATMASVWQLGASGPMNPAMSLKERFGQKILLNLQQSK
jgi:hypothetical protein